MPSRGTFSSLDIRIVNFGNITDEVKPTPHEQVGLLNLGETGNTTAKQRHNDNNLVPKVTFKSKDIRFNKVEVIQRASRGLIKRDVLIITSYYYVLYLSTLSLNTKLLNIISTIELLE